ncbi:hypothetical protein AB0K89_22940 [Streptomyces cinnamoneus]|uniref:hypothetical protein n=1 Tax=Streptomyces cinnamoneus TaxID=53446 RepID=UPI003449CD38
MTWVFVLCNQQATNGYVTYTINGTGGQGYAYMPFHVDGSPGDPLAGTRAGGLFRLDHSFNTLFAYGYYDLHCLSPVC